MQQKMFYFCAGQRLCRIYIRLFEYISLYRIPLEKFDNHSDIINYNLLHNITFVFSSMRMNCVNVDTMYTQEAISVPRVSYGKRRHAKQADTANMPYTVTALVNDVCNRT